MHGFRCFKFTVGGGWDGDYIDLILLKYKCTSKPIIDIFSPLECDYDKLSQLISKHQIDSYAFIEMLYPTTYMTSDSENALKSQYKKNLYQLNLTQQK